MKSLSCNILIFFKPIQLETDAKYKAIGGVLYLQDIRINCYPVIHHSRQMEPTEQNYKTHKVELFAMVKGFKTWHPYFKRNSHTILVITDNDNICLKV